MGLEFWHFFVKLGLKWNLTCLGYWQSENSSTKLQEKSKKTEISRNSRAEESSRNPNATRYQVCSRIQEKEKLLLHH